MSSRSRVAYVLVTAALRHDPGARGVADPADRAGAESGVGLGVSGRAAGRLGAGGRRVILGATTVKALWSTRGSREPVAASGAGAHLTDADRDDPDAERRRAALVPHLRRLATSCRALGVPIPRDAADARGRPRPGAPAAGEPAGRGGGRAAGREHGAGAAGHVEGGPPRRIPTRWSTASSSTARWRRPRRAGADDALLLTVGGQVAETAIWSLFWWEDGQAVRAAARARHAAGRGAGADRGAGGRIEERRADAGRNSAAGRCSWPTRCGGWCRWRRWMAWRCRRCAANGGAGGALLALTQPDRGAYFRRLGSGADGSPWWL